MEIKYSKIKIKKGYIQDVICATCGTSRTIHRKEMTPKTHSFYCVECHKDVAQKI